MNMFTHSLATLSSSASHQVSYLRAPELIRHGSCVLWFSSALMLTGTTSSGLTEFAYPVSHGLLLALLVTIAMPSIAGIQSGWTGRVQRLAVACCYIAIVSQAVITLVPSFGTFIALAVVATSSWLFPIVRSPERVGTLSATSVLILGCLPFLV